MPLFALPSSIGSTIFFTNRIRGLRNDIKTLDDAIADRVSIEKQDEEKGQGASTSAWCIRADHLRSAGNLPTISSLDNELVEHML